MNITYALPVLGQIRRAKEIGLRGYNTYIWSACIVCGKERWTKLTKGTPDCLRCHSCAIKLTSHPIGEKSPAWRGGRNKIEDGYIRVKIYPDDFFFPMAWKTGYVLEHRLVMAKHLGRCLQPWELVHHKGIRNSGIENKLDNLIDNLELTIMGSHIREHNKGYKDGYAKGLVDGRGKQIEELKILIEKQTKQIRMLQWQTKEGLEQPLHENPDDSN